MNYIIQATGLSPWAFGLAALMTFIAAGIRGLTGFGMAIVLVPLLGMVVAPAEAVVIGILLQLLIGPVGLKDIVAEADRDSALRIAMFAVVATPAGLWLLAHSSPDAARIVIAAIAIGAFAMVLLPAKPGQVPGFAFTAGTGIVSGILTGYAAMPGPPVVPYYLRQQMEPRRARASMMLVFFATAIAGSLASAVMGVATIHLFVVALCLFPPMWLGNHLGGKAFGTISPPVWRGCVALLLGAAGVSAVVRAFN
ncbi:MAG: hypothetical protein RLZZ58_2296 [Pseudomonadota bacterium]|jgi:uncharacterized membrane protein YfcA